jgi:hypothetical protein
LFVSTTAPKYVVRVFRMGWYAGSSGRLIATSGPFPGHVQAQANIVEPTHTAVAPWTPSATLPTTSWQPGAYLLRLDGSDGSRGFIPLTVRAESARGRVVLLAPDTTWQAYNDWGCCDLYDGDSGGFAGRSRAVSFDRPYAGEYGAGEFIDRELAIVVAAEQLGLALDYVTDVDLERNPDVLDGARAVISMGHDEYWSPAMRRAVTTARDAGTNIAFLGANAMYRRIRFESSALGADRVVVDYKIAREDPLFGVDNAAVTSDWPQLPDREPESSVTGAMYDCFMRETTPGVVSDPSSFLFAGTNVTAGSTFSGLVGPETDAVDLGDPTPRPLQVLMHSPFECPQGVPSAADMTYYSTVSGAGVFDSGTMDWVCAYGGGCHIPVDTQQFVQRVTKNLLVSFARGPVGEAHPARDNVAAVLGQQS